MSNDRRNDGAAGTDPRSEPTPKSSGSLNSSRPRRPRGTGVTPGRSIRVPTDVWDKAKARCNGEDHVNVSHLCTELLRAYGARTIDMSAGSTASASGQADGSAPLTGRSEAPVDPDALRIIIDSYRALADRLEALLDDPAAATASPPELGPRPSPRGAVFDPETSVPPVAPMPTGGTREQADWCGLIFFGMLRAINVRQGRGATPGERTAIARAAGYQDARAYSGWTWTWQDRPDGRWITEDDDAPAEGRRSGMTWLRLYAETLNVTLPGDLG